MRAAAREAEERDDFVGNALREPVGARVGHRARHVEERLLPEVEGGADDELAGMIEPEATTDEGRVLAGREGGGDEDRRGAVFPQPLAKLAADPTGAHASASGSAHDLARALRG